VATAISGSIDAISGNLTTFTVTTRNTARRVYKPVQLLHRQFLACLPPTAAPTTRALAWSPSDRCKPASGAR
jgi:hypothetical protein